MNDDLALLQEYARNGSEGAFTALVARYVNLVHSVALRQVGNPHLAAEVTQAVFIILARKAGSRDDRTILPGWLCRTARYAGANALTIQRRRQHREQEAYMQSLANEPEPADWRPIAPLLEGAMERLGQKDHDALVLRYFEGRSLKEVGAALGASEDAAKVRVGRALDKLRKFFAKRGVDSTADVIAKAISGHAVMMAPAGLTKTVAVIAAGKGVAAGAGTLTIIQGASKMMAWAKMKMAAGVGLALVFVVGSVLMAEKLRRPAVPPAGGGVAVFIVRGVVSYVACQNQLDTNCVFTKDGDFLFSYSNGIWQIQFTERHYTHPKLNFEYPDSPMGAMTDDKRIPGGMRQINTFAPSAEASKFAGKNQKRLALVRPARMPNIADKCLFLPWLSLCPNPELPLADSNHIHYVFDDKVLGTTNDVGGFRATYFGPGNCFLSELVATNNGRELMADGTVFKLPPPYDHGYVGFSFQALETTNCQGIEFPLRTVLSEFTVKAAGKTREDIYPAIVSTLTVQQIDIGGRHLLLAPVPASVVAMDSRSPVLKNNVTMNYEVTNDQYFALTNVFLKRLENMYRHNQRMRQAPAPGLGGGN